MSKTSRTRQELSGVACPSCGETNDPQYETCWNCDADLRMNVVRDTRSEQED